MQWVLGRYTSKGRSGHDGTLALGGRPHLTQLQGLPAQTVLTKSQGRAPRRACEQAIQAAQRKPDSTQPQNKEGQRTEKRGGFGASTQPATPRCCAGCKC